MSKNVVIFVLSFVVAILIGILLLTNYNWFSDEWLAGLGFFVGGLAGIGIYFYIKIKK